MILKRLHDTQENSYFTPEIIWKKIKIIIFYWQHLQLSSIMILIKLSLLCYYHFYGIHEKKIQIKLNAVLQTNILQY